MRAPGSESRGIIAFVEEAAGETARHVIDIFMMSIKCGNCDTYQTVMRFTKLPDKNVYTYECENEICDPDVTRTIVEVPKQVDNSVKRAEELPYYDREESPEV